MKKIILLLFLLSSSHTFASVWEASNSWSEQWQSTYQQWIGSSALYRNIFRDNPDPILRKLPTDCADALYALRIYFSYKNRLPFKMHSPDEYQQRTGEEFLSNEVEMFDDIEQEGRRVRAFIRYVLRESGTLNLVKDTFPLAIKAITSGDIYVTEWSLLGESFRHSYVIKSIDPHSGNGLFYWSDAPAKVRKLGVTKKYPDFVFDGRPWGYRRWKTPQQLEISEDMIPFASGYSLEQYDLLHRYGKNRVLLEIRKRMRKE